MKITTCNFHVDDSQGNHKYNIIIGREIFSKLKMYLFLTDHVIRGKGGTYEGCNTPMKYMINITVNTSSARLHEETFWKE